MQLQGSHAQARNEARQFLVHVREYVTETCVKYLLNIYPFVSGVINLAAGVGPRCRYVSPDRIRISQQKER